MKKEIITLLFAMTPIFELRGSMPYGLISGIEFPKVLLLSLVGNFLPVIPLYFFLQKVLNFLNRFHFGRKFSVWLITRTKKKSKIVEKYQTVGLLVFVGIPLPGTGAWTGTVAAVLLKLTFRDFIIGVTGGILLASGIVSGVWFTGSHILKTIFLSFGK